MIQSTWKSIFPAFAAILIITSCSSSRQATVASRGDIKGTWTLDKITYEGLATSERLRLILLDEGNEACVTGSTWVLPNNGYGSYTINSSQAGCVSGSKNIVWSYSKEGDQPVFQYKRLPGGEKAKDITEGYRFRILSASDNTMTMQSEIRYQGNPIFITYSFTKS
jgi:Lipocalin-like domain